MGDAINKALSEYKQEVENRSFPGAAHTPYRISATDVDGFLNELQKMGMNEAATAAAAAAKNVDTAGRPLEDTCWAWILRSIASSLW